MSAVIAIAAAPLAWAQEGGEGSGPAAAPTPPKPAGIEEIVVHAGESDAVSDVEEADSVTGFDASDLEALGAQTIQDIGKFTPNLEIVTTGATTPTFFIRGVGLNDNVNANSVSAVSVYQDDVPVNSPAIQLGTLFDMEGVNVLRGPQGTGPARNASAGAIKLYSRKPSGEYGSFLRSTFGNFEYKDFEGAVEAPLYEDIVASRFAFRWSERDGYGTNGCGNAIPVAQRQTRQRGGENPTDPPVSLCGESVRRGISQVPEDLASRTNNLANWAARGTLLFQPTLDMEWLLGVHGARRDELSRLGQSYGTNNTQIFPDGSSITGRLGAADGGGYQPQEVKDAIAAETAANGLAGEAAINAARIAVHNQLANLDNQPHRGDYNKTGPTRNDTLGGYLKGEIALPAGLELTSVSGYDQYDRFVDIDLDFSPNTLFHITTDDQGWQATQELRLAGQVADDVPVRWEVGAFGLIEELDVRVDNDFGGLSFAGVAAREYIQTLYSAAGYFEFGWDFWDSFTLDGGVRYNWENKIIDFTLRRGEVPFLAFLDNTWQAPTGTLRLTYRFREDTHWYWKYTRGWKGGHYNATAADANALTVAQPETIDAFETGMRGSWWQGRLGVDFSVFYYGYENYQIFTAEQNFNSPPEFVVLNANNAEVYGSEIDVSLRPLPGTFLQARASWLESQFLDFVQTQVGNLTTADGSALPVVRERQNSGNRLLNSPQFKASLTAEQTVPLGRFGSLTARWDGAWSDITYYDATQGKGIPNEDNVNFLPDTAIAQKPFWLHNLRLGYRPPRGNVEIAGWIRNVNNEVYKTFAFDASTFNQTTIYFVGEPRTFGMTLTVNFY